MVGRWLVFSLYLVALRKESVDRNNLNLNNPRSNTNVALRKESVDRNAGVLAIVVVAVGALSARRAWIEILVLTSVYFLAPGRSPQGERG